MSSGSITTPGGPYGLGKNDQVSHLQTSIIPDPLSSSYNNQHQYHQIWNNPGSTPASMAGSIMGSITGSTHTSMSNTMTSPTVLASPIAENQDIKLPSFMDLFNYTTEPLRPSLMYLDSVFGQSHVKPLDYYADQGTSRKLNDPFSTSLLALRHPTTSPSLVAVPSFPREKSYSNVASYNSVLKQREQRLTNEGSGVDLQQKKDRKIPPQNGSSQRTYSVDHERLSQPSQSQSIALLEGNDSVEAMKLEIALKNQIIESLKKKVMAMEVCRESPQANSSTPEGITMPNNYYQLFRDLTRTLNERTHELQETKTRMEAILVGIVMAKDCTITTHGSFDCQDLAHKITNKLSVLQRENEALLKMVSYSNKQSLVIELGLLKSENKMLKEKLKEKRSS